MSEVVFNRVSNRLQKAYFCDAIGA